MWYGRTYLAGALLTAVMLTATVLRGNSYLIEAETFQFPGDWCESADRNALSKKSMGLGKAGKDTVDAEGIVCLPQAGNYSVWVRTRDFSDNTGARRFRLGIDDTLLTPELGAHGYDGWRWEKAGECHLTAGDHVIFLRDVSHFYARCDAVLFAAGKDDPNRLTDKELVKLKLPLRKLTLPHCRDNLFAAVPKVTVHGEPIAVLSNKQLKVEFCRGTDAAGQPRIVRQLYWREDSGWRRLPLSFEHERMFVLRYDQGAVSHSIFPKWNAGGSEVKIRVGDRERSFRCNQENPFLAGRMTIFVPVEVKPSGSSAVTIGYRSLTDGQMLQTRWTLPDSVVALQVDADYRVPAAGNYSIDFLAGEPLPSKLVNFIFCPPHHLFLRQAVQPMLSLSSLMAWPLALVDTGSGSERVTFGVVADPKQISFDWPEYNKTPYGFTVQTTDGKIQPGIFAPPPCFGSSRVVAGGVLRSSWMVLTLPGSWETALEYTGRNLFQVKDYRRPTTASLTDAILNMFDLMQDPKANGFNLRMKGYYNIEAKQGVINAAVLMPLAASLLNRNERFYADIALPIMEYALTRNTGSFSDEQAQQAFRPLALGGGYYGTAVYGGFYTLLGGLDPWLKTLALPDGKASQANLTGWKHIPQWSEELAAYRLAPSPERLRRIQELADAFIAKDIYGRHARLINPNQFYNVNYYPYWFDLLDLYELTGASRYLEAARTGASMTIAGTWALPLVPDGNTVIHSGGTFPGIKEIWWRYNQRYRLGFPLRSDSVRQKTVPAWQVARNGLGYEQGTTYFNGMKNVLMSSWTPALLRLAAYTGDDFYRTVARNGIIGRFANYPSYYYLGYTDLIQDAAFPYHGPDTGNIYYHHIPVHLMFAVDYLFAQAEERSGGKIRFPWVKQQGYAWFSNRVYGAAGGEIFDRKQIRPWLQRSLIAPGPEIDWLAGTSERGFHLVLMSQSDRSLPLRLQLNSKLAGIDPAVPVTVVQRDGSSHQIPLAELEKEMLPPMGIVALHFASSLPPFFRPLPPLTVRPVIRPLADPAWGKLIAFRLRSEFGTDSLYVGLSDGMAGKGTLKVVVKGNNTTPPKAVTSFPYEVTIYPYPIDREALLIVTLTDGEGRTLLREELTL